MKRSPSDVLLSLSTGLVYVYLYLPLLVVVYFSFSQQSFFRFPPDGFSLQWYETALSAGLFIEPAVRSVVVAVASTVLATLPSVPAALAIRRMASARSKRVAEFVLLSPLVVPAVILGIALLYYFQGAQLLDTFTGLLLAHVILVLPFVFRSVLVSAQSLERQYEEASAILGASGLTTFRRVVLPSLMPGIVAGGIFSFIVSFDQFTISLFVVQREQTTLPIALYQYLADRNDPAVAAVATVLVGLGLLITFIIQRLGWLDRVAQASA